MPIKAKKTTASMNLDTGKDVWEFTNTVGVVKPISRKHLFTIISEFGSKSLLFDLVPKEKADIREWYWQPIKLVVEDGFIARGFTWAEMEQWIKSCYRMQENPLRSLRRIFEDSLSNAVYYRNVLKCGQYPKSYQAGLTCVHDQRNPSKPSVKLVAYGTFDDLVQENARIERELKAAGIH